LALPKRSDQQKRNLADLLAASRSPERTLVPRLAWATLVTDDISRRFLGGRNPFTNERVQYRGSRDDKALNAGVPRLKPDPDGVSKLAEDGDFNGNVTVPVMTLHATGDLLAPVEHEAAYRATLEKAGTDARLLQLFMREDEHMSPNAQQYVAALDALVGWIDTGKKPAAGDIANSCEALSRVARGDPCHFDAKFQPQSWDSRVSPRPR
jgi:hypothetical protein